MRNVDKRLNASTAILLFLGVTGCDRASDAAATQAEVVEAVTGLTGSSADALRPVVAGYELLRGSSIATESARGGGLLGELNCLSCHTVPYQSRGIVERISTKPAPDLAKIGERVTPEWLTAYLKDPHGQKPGTTMPDLFHSVESQERDAAVEQITHFLIGESGAEESPGYRPFRFRAMVQRGRESFHSLGCVSCHAAEESDGDATIPSISLPDLASKTSVGALSEFLRDPESIRHGGRMPSLYLEENEANDIAVYLLREQEPAEVDRISGFEFEYYEDAERDEDVEGFFSRPAPDFDMLTPEGVGHIDTLSLQLPIRTRRGNRAFRYSGLINVEMSGEYTVHLSSDRRSGTAVLIDDQVVATKTRDAQRDVSGVVELTAGDHSISVTYYIRGDTEEPFLEVSIESGEEPTPIEALVAYEDVVLEPRSTSFEVDRVKARQGRRMFSEIGCASCHALASAATDVAVRYPARSLDVLNLGSSDWVRVGHLAPGAPKYGLALDQREAIGVALADLDELSRPRDAEAQVVHTLATYNCYACHIRDDGSGSIGGPDETREQYFEVLNGMDLGDEGRIPPTLAGIGGKLKQGALQSILTQDELHVRRNYMVTRMPRFAGDLIEQLPGLLSEVDSVAGDLAEPALSPQTIDDGLMLVGVDGLNCITCHDVGANKAPGISMVNLSTVYDRLRPGWVMRFLEAPSAINVGTRMLTYWFGDGVVHEDIAGGTVDGQVKALWSYMSLGASMPVPAGMDVGSSMVLRPLDTPLIFRTFMREVGPRSILVGYPESVHVAFDANVIRLAKAWRGGFFDAKGTWQGRAGQFFTPYGEDVIDMPPGPAFALLEGSEAPWPQAGFNDRDIGGDFLGYHLDEQRRPTFKYRLEGIEIQEQPVPVVRAGGSIFIRRFTLESANDSNNLYLMLAQGEEITQTGDRSWRVDDDMSISLSSRVPTDESLRPLIRSSSGVRELLLPVILRANRPVSLDVEVSW